MGGNLSCIRPARRTGISLETRPGIVELYGPFLENETKLRKVLIRSYEGTLDETTLQHIKLVGSLAEGSLLSRHYGFKEPERTFLYELEFDSMWNIGEILCPESAAAIVFPVEKKDGFFSIHGQDFIDHCCSFNQDGINKTMEVFYKSEKIRDNIMTDQLIDAASIRLFQRLWIGQNRGRHTHYTRSATMARCFAAPCPLLVPCTRVEVVNEDNGPCSKSETTVFTGGDCTKQRNYCLAVDNVLYVTIPWPAQVANDFKSRSRRTWPSAEQIDKITQTPCQLVPKSEDDPVEWRLSFSEVEQKYKELYGRNRDLVFLAFKCTFYQHVFPVQYEFQGPTLNHDSDGSNVKNIGSYIAKTVMMWLCERTTNKDWTDDQLSQRHFDVCDWLKNALQTRCLPHFFIPEVNLLKDIPTKKCEEAASRLKNEPPTDVALCLAKATHIRRKLNGLPSRIRGKVTLTYTVLGEVVDQLSPSWRHDELQQRQRVMHDTDQSCCCMNYSPLICPACVYH